MAKKTASTKKGKRGGGRPKKPPAVDKLPDPSEISDDQAALVVRDRLMIQMRLAGHTYQEIADECGVAKSTVFRTVDRVLAQERSEAAAGLDQIAHDREVEAARLELVVKRLMSLAGLDIGKTTGARIPKHFKWAIEQIGKYHDRIVTLRGLKPTPDVATVGAEDPLTTAMRSWPREAQDRILAVFIQQQNLIVNSSDGNFPDGDGRSCSEPDTAVDDGGRGPGNFPPIPQRDYVK